MIDKSYLRPDEAKALFNQWIDEQSKDFMDKDNARFQIGIDENGILLGLML